MLSLKLSLLLGNDDVGMKLVLLAPNQTPDRGSHLLHQEVVQLRVKVVSLVLLEAGERLLLSLEVLFHDSHDGLLHFFFHDVVLALSVDLVEEFLFHILKLLVDLFLSELVVGLHVRDLLAEHRVELLGKRLHCERDLLAEVVARIFTVGPGDELLRWYDFVGLRLGVGGALGHNGRVEANFQMNISFCLLETLFEGLLLDLLFGSVGVGFFGDRSAGLKIDSAGELSGARLGKLFQTKPGLSNHGL